MLLPLLRRRWRSRSSSSPSFFFPVNGHLSRRRVATLSPDDGDRLLLQAAEKALKTSRPSLQLETAWHSVRRAQELIHGARKIAQDTSEEEELRSLASLEVEEAERAYRSDLARLKTTLLPRDPIEDEDAILEIRAGVGGEEATLFVGEVLRMYQRYATLQGWHFTVLDASIDSGQAAAGVREATANVKGEGAYGALRNEAGVHRVQRVPKTETSGRIHTSTIALVVLPDKRRTGGNGGGGEEDDDAFLAPGQLERETRIDLYRAGGKGGQNVNKVETAVRLTHNPTGIVVTMQDTRSQFQNKERAWQVLRARLLDRHLVARAEQERASRQDQVTTVTRSDKTRTFNYPQNRVTDHRTGFHLYDLQGCLQGSSLGLVIENVRQWQESQRLEALLRHD